VGENQHGPPVQGLEDPGVGEKPEFSVEHDAGLRLSRPERVADSEAGIVRQDRADAHEQGVVLGPEEVGIVPGGE
jgi:hypothetical protein